MALARNLLAKIYEIKAHNGKVTRLDLGETGRVLVTGGEDRNVNLWAIGLDECFMSFTGHNRSIECVRFAYKDNFVYSADDIGIIRRWDLNAQTMYSTLNGHMKNVRTLDFNSSGEYVVSGSNDTTVRLWNVQNENKCIKIFRGHISHVNSVKFSPDGLWIASAGLEGSILIWDIRKNKKIMDLVKEPPVSAITCIQFHPFEFLLVAGHVNGTVSIYDLEQQVMISRTDSTSSFYGQPIKCITFSENGECLFVGTTSGISVIGWEPDRTFDYIKSTSASLGDMKVINNKLICGCYDVDTVSINTVSLDYVLPFRLSTNAQTKLKHSTTTRKSFSPANKKFQFLPPGLNSAALAEEHEDAMHKIYDDHSLPNIDIKVVNDAKLEPNEISAPSALHHMHAVNPSVQPGYASAANTAQQYNTYSCLDNYDECNSDSNISYDINMGQNRLYGPGSLIDPVDGNNKKHDGLHAYNPIDYSLQILSNYEMAEDFPVNSNTNNTTSSGAPISTINASLKSIKKGTTNLQKRNNTMSNSRQTSTTIFGSRKLGQTSSVSSMELHKMDDNLVLSKSSSSNVVNRNKRIMGSQGQFYKENTQLKNFNVEIITKPPTRSRTSLDMRPTSNVKVQEKHANNACRINYRPDLIPTTGKNMNRFILDDPYVYEELLRSHENVLQELNSRQANLDMLRNSTQSHDIIGALRQAKNSGRSIFVDLLGTIIEKPSSWNLDLCTSVLPEIYELLQSQHKFHFTRACDTLRIILSHFLPIIQDNLDPWAANGLGVDVTREDRQRKCTECWHWLLQIKNLSEESCNFVTSTLTQLQNLIIV